MNLLADVPSRRLPVSVVAVNSAIAAGCLERHPFVHVGLASSMFLYCLYIFPMFILNLSYTNPAQEQILLFLVSLA